jgi:hypothetical protein
MFGNAHEELADKLLGGHIINSLRDTQSNNIAPGVRVDDACRYVEDLRIVLEINSEVPLTKIKFLVANWIQELLNRCKVPESVGRQDGGGHI